jgi:Xaa-Pro aminopeptidase
MPSFLSFVEPTRPFIDWARLQKLRHERARKIMKEQKVDAILTNVVDSVIYLTGWPKHRTSVHPGAYATLFIADAIEPIIFCSEGDARGMLQDRFYEDIRVIPPWQRLWPKEFAEAVADRSLDKATIALDGRMTATLHAAIVEALPSAKIVNAGPLLDIIRRVKNPDEIAAYEYTLSLVECGINAAIRAATDSWSRYTEIEIAAIGQNEMLKRGCHSTDIWCISGPRAAPVRRYSTDKVVRGGELAVIDGPGSFNGFRAEFARTVWTGGIPAKEHTLLYRTIWQSQQEARRVMRPGTRASALEEACLAPVMEAGLEKFYGGYPYTGHGIGIRAEAFNVTARFPELDLSLEEGMILNLEPALWQEGVGGVRLEDTYLITADGYRTLSRAPYEDRLLG